MTRVSKMEITYPTTTPPEFLSEENVELLKRTILDPFSEDDQNFFITICNRKKLDPFTKQVHPTKRDIKHVKVGDKLITYPGLVPVMSYESFILIAQRTGHYNGLTIEWASDKEGEEEIDPVWHKAWKPSWGYPALAQVTVHHKQHQFPAVAIVTWNAYAQYTKDGKLNTFWRKMPEWMLAKCGIGLACRMAFPDDLGGFYEESEIPEETEKEEQHDGSVITATKNVKFVDRIDRPVAKPVQEEEDFSQEVAAPVEEPPVEEEGDADPDPEEPVAAPEPKAEVSEAWKDHIVTGIKDVRFNGKRVGDISPTNYDRIARWMNGIKDKWAAASPEQKADWEAFNLALQSAAKEFDLNS